MKTPRSARIREPSSIPSPKPISRRRRRPSSEARSPPALTRSHPGPITSSQPSFTAPVPPRYRFPTLLPAPPPASTPNVDINAIVQAVVRSDPLVDKAASNRVQTRPLPSPLQTPTRPRRRDTTPPFPLIQLLTRGPGTETLTPSPYIYEHASVLWLREPLFRRGGGGSRIFTETLPGNQHTQICLLRLQLVYGLLPDRLLSIFLQKTTYERGGFMMWARILDKYNPRGKVCAIRVRLGSVQPRADPRTIPSAPTQVYSRRPFRRRSTGITFKTIGDNLFVKS